MKKNFVEVVLDLLLFMLIAAIYFGCTWLVWYIFTRAW